MATARRSARDWTAGETPDLAWGPRAVASMTLPQQRGAGYLADHVG